MIKQINDKMRILKSFNPLNHSSDNFLGGQNNNHGGMAGLMIAGNGITAAIPNALHVNGLWANGIPNCPTAAITGKVVAWQPGFPPLPASARQLWIL